MKKQILLVLVFIGILVFLLIINQPNKERIYPFKENTIIYNGEMLNHQVVIEDGKMIVPLDFIKEYIDDTLYIDEATSSIIITTGNKVVQFKNNELQAFVNQEPLELRAAIAKNGENWEIPYMAIKDFYPFDLTYNKNTKLAVLTKKGEEIEKAEITIHKKDIPVRLGASKKKPIVSFVKEKETVAVLKKEKKWTNIQKENGHVGYIPTKYLSTSWKEKEPWKEEEKSPTTDLKDKKINLVWEAVYTHNPKTENIPRMDGVNVVSPTWFELGDKSGNVNSKADAFYVEWAKKNNMQVWALFSNAFNPDLTHEFLKNYTHRMNTIKQLLAYAELYELDGINLDFENVYLEDKEELVQFVRELTPYLHREGLLVSMDVTIHSSSEMWSRFYDREKLAEVVDYMMVMTYDEHPAASQTAGSVASLPWVENGLKGILEEIPPEKLLLGIPFYTRVWTETKKGLTSETLSMKNTKEFLQKNKLSPIYDEKTKQNYVEFKNKKVWLEDETSLMKRLNLVESYNLAGVASWQRGFAEEEMWKLIDENLQNKKD